MPTSGSVTRKRSLSVERLTSLPPALLLAVIGTVYAGLDIARHGPFWEWLRENVFLPSHVAATVNGSFITQSEVELADDLLLAAGASAAETTVTDSLVRTEVIRQAAISAGAAPPADWVERAIDTFESGFPPGKLPALLQAEELSPGAYREILKAHLSQVHWLDQLAEEARSLSGESWLLTHQAAVFDPEVIRARHIFLSTIESDTPERGALIREIHRKLTMPVATFANLAAEFSEDERTKRSGGDLGYFSRQRIPADFAARVFRLSPGQLSEPFRTRIGWHIVEVTERLATRPPHWPAVRNEVELHLRNEAKHHRLDTWWEGFSRSEVRK